MKTRKSYLTWVLISILIFVTVLTGCSKQPDAKVVEIEFYQQNSIEVDIFNKIIADFEKAHPNIKVKQVNLPEEESGTVLGTRILNGDSPDIYNDWFSQDIFNKIKSGNVKDLTGSPLLSYVADDVLKQTAFNGKNYMVPITQNFMGVYYNVDLFEKYDVKIPTTLNEFWTVCEKFQSLGITPISASDKDGWNLAHWAQDVMGMYMPNYSNDFENIFDKNISGSQIQGISEFADIIINRTKYVQSGSLGTDTDSSISEFVNGKTAMTLNGSWIVPSIESANSNFNYGIFPFPGNTADETKVMSNADFSFVLSAKSSAEKQEAAEIFLNYILTEGVKYYVAQTNAPSAVKGVNSDSSRYTLIRKILDDGKTFRMPYSGRWTDETYLNYTVALQNLVATGDKETFYTEFELALTSAGKPADYLP